MLKYSLITLAVFLSFTLPSQINYLDIRDQYSVSCGQIDSSELIQNQIFVDSLMNLSITKGRDKFLYDFAWVYYRRYLKWKDISDIRTSNKYNNECWELFGSTNALWNLGGGYGILNDCDKKLELTELYIKTMKDQDQEEYISYKQVYYRYKSCH